MAVATSVFAPHVHSAASSFMNSFRVRAALVCFFACTVLNSIGATQPNIIFILADDLGYGDIGAFGQTKIRTPNLDRLAASGMKLTAHYAGANVCAPSRCTLLSGKHQGHAYIRDNRGGIGAEREGQEPVPAGELSLPLTLKKLGYSLGCVGKWGLGPVGSTGDPLNQGFDRFFGYNCQAQAHNFYPAHLWSDREKVLLENERFTAHQKLPADADPTAAESYARYSSKQYSADLISGQALEFVRQNKEKSFFLYYATTVPHLALQVPEDSLQEYAGAFPEEPYIGGNGYLPHRTPRAAYAAMITRMDREIGKLLDLLQELKLSENTIIVFTSDNGPLYNRLGGTDAEFFNSAANFRGRKGSYYEGGFREPCLVNWPGKIAAGSSNDRVTGFEDWTPTLLELIGQKDSTPSGLDGISFSPTLLGQMQEPRPFLYRESPGYGGQQAVRVGDWKLVRQGLNPGPKAKNPAPPKTELYNLASDPSEKSDVAAQHPDVVEKLSKVAREQHTKSKLFAIRALDN
jgi:arylsulfatase A